MALSCQRVKNLVQVLSFAVTTSSAAMPFVLATASGALCLQSRASKLLSLRPNQIFQSKRGQRQVCCHEAVLREQKSARGAVEAQAREICSRDCELAVDMKKHCAKWASACEQAIGRRLQDDDSVFPHVSEKGSVNPKVSMWKGKYEKWANLWSEIARTGTATLGLKGFFALRYFRRGGAQHQLVLAKCCKRAC